MKKLSVSFFFLLSVLLLPLSVQSADQTLDVPPPPDIETTSPPSLPSTDKSADIAIPPPPPLSTTDDKKTDVSVPPPPVLAPESDKTSSSTADISVPPPPPVQSEADNKKTDVSAPPADKTTSSTVNDSVPPPPVVPTADDKKSEVSVPAPPLPAVEAAPPAKTAEKSEESTAPKAVKKSKKKKTNEPIAAKPVEIPQPTPTAAPAGPGLSQLVTAYKYAYELYAANQFDKAKDIFKKISMVTDEPTLMSNSLYYYSQCAFRTEDYVNCVKGLKVLVKKAPDCSAIKKGFVTRFCVFLIDQASNLQTNWDYFRYQVADDENGNPVWKESIPPGPKIKRINFRLGFGLYSVLHAIQPDSPEDAAAKQKLQKMLDAPLTVVWVDEKAAKTNYGHSGDFLSLFSTNEKKNFSKVICDRMFFNFQTEYFYKFLDMHDDVRNLRPRFVAVNKIVKETAQAGAPPLPESNEASGAITTAVSTEEDPNKILTLYNLLHVAGYYPWLDSYSNTIEAAPTDLNL